ncbi:argininosuccinate lyase [Streptomyces sp. 4F14]|uniref:argininosuccinate lyase n=1 Tax=Streptomyces sp. 4F14 TaxID=3394380 RepID=UPI003A8BD58D
MNDRRIPDTRLSGRISAAPSDLLHREILEPQFRYEAEHLLPWYVTIEKVLALEYGRMGLIEKDDVRRIGSLLDEITADGLRADPEANYSDIAFAVERQVEQRLDPAVPRWHVDRSRNDLQACAQLLFGRSQVLRAAEALSVFGRSAHRLAAAHTDTPMPGYTHLQSAQIITPGFYLAALTDRVLHAMDRLLAAYRGIDLCPLGAGAMAGQEIPWDRAEMARLLGFRAANPHALTAVASRDWAVEVTAELSLAATWLGRFCTDLMAWGSSEYGLIELPDALSGISSAMPQKKNYPVLERIRGRTAHLVSLHLDAVLGQRNTSYSNSVEVSKEAGTHVLASFDTLCSTLELFTTVLDHLSFREDRALALCEREFLGGFSLANLLTLDEGVPWRRAQVVAGQFITACVEKGLTPRQADPELLRAVALQNGFELSRPEHLVAESFDVRRGLLRKCSPGSAHPDAVRALLAEQAARFDALDEERSAYGATVDAALARTDGLLGLGDAKDGER